MPTLTGLVRHNNPVGAIIDLTENQVVGTGIFANKTERDALDVGLQTPGYRAVMLNTNTVEQYTGGAWNNKANWTMAGDYAAVATVNTVTELMTVNAAAGEVLRTLGYTEVLDGGACIYDIVVSAPTTVEHVITLNNGLFAVAQFTGAVNPTQWGAIANDTTKDAVNSTAMNAMFAYLSFHSSESDNPLSCLFITGKYYIKSTVFLPTATFISSGEVNAALGSYVIDFNNSTLYATDPTIDILHRKLDITVYSAAQFSPSSYVDTSLIISNVTLDGVANAQGGVGLWVEATYNSEFSNINAKNLEFGIRLDFCLQALITSSLINACQTGVYLSNDPDGTWGSTLNNNQCNRTKLDMVRIYMSDQGTNIATTGVKIESSAGVEVHNCIIEGNNPSDCCVYVDLSGATVTDFYLNNIHIETVYNDAANSIFNSPVFRLVSDMAATANLMNVYAQSLNRLLVNASNFEGLVVYSTPYFDQSHSFETNSTLSNLNLTKWKFAGGVDYNIIDPGTNSNPVTNTYWVGDMRPTNMGCMPGDANQTNVLNTYVSGTMLVKGVTASLESYPAADSGVKSAFIANGSVGTITCKSLYLKPSHILYIEHANGSKNLNVKNKSDSITTLLNSPKKGRANNSSISIDYPPASGIIPCFSPTIVPLAPTDSGERGEIRTDAIAMYICISTNLWKKVLFDTFI